MGGALARRRGVGNIEGWEGTFRMSRGDQEAVKRAEKNETREREKRWIEIETESVEEKRGRRWKSEEERGTVRVGIQ